MTWAATQAKAKFSEVLDRAETEGPQLVRRRKRDFILITREEMDAIVQKAGTASKNKTSPPRGRRTTAAFFQNSPLRNSGIELSRIHLSPRHIDL